MSSRRLPNIPSQQDFKELVKAFLAETGMAPTTFSRQATGNPNFAAEVEAGSAVRLQTAHQVIKFMRKHQRECRRAEDKR